MHQMEGSSAEEAVGTEGEPACSGQFYFRQLVRHPHYILGPRKKLQFRTMMRLGLSYTCGSRSNGRGVRNGG